MKFPVVSRLAFDALFDAMKRMAQRDQEQIDDLRARLTTTTDALRLANEAVREHRTNPVTPDAPAGNIRRNGVAAAAIRQMAQGDTRLAEYLHKRKRELRREHPTMSDEGIVELLSVWETTEEATGVSA